MMMNLTPWHLCLLQTFKPSWLTRMGKFLKNFHFLCYIAASKLRVCTKLSGFASFQRHYWSPGNVHFYPGEHVGNIYIRLNIFLSKSWSCSVSFKAITCHAVFCFKYVSYLRKGSCYTGTSTIIWDIQVDVQATKLIYFVSAYQDGAECKVVYHGILHQRKMGAWCACTFFLKWCYMLRNMS